MHQNQKLSEIKKLVEAADLSLQQAKELLHEITGTSSGEAAFKARRSGAMSETDDGQVVEGVFDGQQMIGPDGKRYSIPANYASKSKLVEGDLMKLTIDGRGNFIFKQIGPVERVRLKGNLAQDEKTGDWRVLVEGKAYRILLASVTYFKGKVGDSAVILVPQDKSSTWAAVENIIPVFAETEPQVEPREQASPAMAEPQPAIGLSQVSGEEVLASAPKAVEADEFEQI